MPWSGLAPLIDDAAREELIVKRDLRGLFEFAFFTGMRPQEIIALRWDAVDRVKRQAHVCRAIAQGVIKERTKTKKNRYVLLNDRALHALAFAEQYAERRKAGTGAIKDFPYVFPPSKMSQHVRQTSDLH